MYVCLCCGVTDARVREAIAAGATDVAELGRRTGAGTDCGQCRERLGRLIVDAGSGVDRPEVDHGGGTDAG